MTKTNETRCILAPSCQFAGSDAKCHDRCPAYIQMHSASGRHTLARLPADYALTRLETAPPRVDQPEAYGIIDGYAATFERQFDAGERVKSLYLYSAEPGTGKTTSAAALLNEYLRVHYVGSVRRGVQPSKNPAMFLGLNAWQSDYNLATMTRDEEGLAGFERKMRRASEVPFMVADDIGVRDATPAFRGYIHHVFNARMERGLATVFTSNVKMDDLASIYDARLADRVRDQCVEVPFKGRSKRGLRK